jgi:hypothetical protein
VGVGETIGLGVLGACETPACEQVIMRNASVAALSFTV